MGYECHISISIIIPSLLHTHSYTKTDLKQLILRNKKKMATQSNQTKSAAFRIKWCTISMPSSGQSYRFMPNRFCSPTQNLLIILLQGIFPGNAVDIPIPARMWPNSDNNAKRVELFRELLVGWNSGSRSLQITKDDRHDNWLDLWWYPAFSPWCKENGVDGRAVWSVYRMSKHVLALSKVWLANSSSKAMQAD